MGYRAAPGRPSRPRDSRPRSDRDRDLSARQRQGRCLCAAPRAIALVREIAEAGRVDAGERALIQPESAMISRFPGLTPTRSRAVVHDDLVLTVAVAPDPVTSSMYEQSAKALARIDESLALCGSDKSKILSAIVYITDMKRKGEMNRAWLRPSPPLERNCAHRWRSGVFAAS